MPSYCIILIRYRCYMLIYINIFYLQFEYRLINFIIQIYNYASIINLCKSYIYYMTTIKNKYSPEDTS